MDRCEAPEGPAIRANYSGSMVLDGVEIQDSHASSQCGGISIYGRGRATTTLATGSTLSFQNTRSEGRGACMCLFMDPSASFMALYQTTHSHLLSATSCVAQKEGIVYAEGGLVILSNVHALSNQALSGGFLMAKELVMLKINSAMIQNVTAIGDGSAFAVYDSTEVDMSGVSVSSCHAGGSGTIYLEGGEGAYLADLSMKLNSAGEYGVGIIFYRMKEWELTRK